MTKRARIYYQDAMNFLEFVDYPELEKGRTVESSLKLQNYYLQTTISLIRKAIENNTNNLERRLK